MNKSFFEKAPLNIYEALYPTYWIFSFHGYFPFTFIGDPKYRELKTTGRNIFILISWLIFLSTLLYLNITSFGYDFISTRLMQAADLFCAIFGLLSVMYIILYQMKKRENIKVFLSIMYNIDEMVRFFPILILKNTQ